MTSFGVTGHQMRPGIDWTWVRAEVRRRLGAGGAGSSLWTCLATGADTIAAEEALGLGIRLGTVVPHAGYEDVFGDGDRRTYLDLLDRSAEVVLAPPRPRREEAYLVAGEMVADRGDLLLAVWDGRPAAGLGGTADIVLHAGRNGKSVLWLDVSTTSVRDGREARIGAGPSSTGRWTDARSVTSER